MFIWQRKQQTTVTTDKGIQKTMTSRETRARIIDATIDNRSRRLQDRLNKRSSLSLLDTHDAKKPKNTTKKARLIGGPVVGKEKMGSRSEFSDDEKTPSLACDESVSDAREQTNQLRKGMGDVGWDNQYSVERMTIAHDKKDEVSLLSAPSQSTKVSVDDSVFKKLNPVVKSAWKDQTKGMTRILGPCVRDEFMKDYKFCNEKICRHIVTKCMARNEIVLTPGMTYDQFVDVTSKSPIVSKLFNSQRHHIQSKMRGRYIGEKISSDWTVTCSQ